MNRTLKAALGLTMIALSPGAAAAQVASSLDDVVRARRLTRGEAVYVTVAGGRRVKAEIEDASSAGVWLRDGRRRWQVAEEELLRVERRDSVHDGIWIGVAVGVLATPLTCSFGREVCAFSELLGALVGGLVDAGHREVLYEARRGGRRVRVSPILTRGGAGAGMSLGW